MIPHDPLRIAEQAAVAEEIVSALRHDFRNRMTAVRNGAYYVERRLKSSELAKSDPRLLAFLRIVDEESLLACNLLEDTSVTDRLLVRKAERTRVSECIAAALEAVRISGAQVDVTAEPAEVMADRVELSLALRCLIENALEASPAGARVRVRMEHDPAYARVAVTNDADGEVADGERVLTQFFTTKSGHAGLGTNIARRIARRYQGDLRFERSGIGAVATLAFPLLEDAPP